MAYKIRVSSLARKNIDNAIEYHLLQSQSAAKKFNKKLLQSYQVLQTNPYFIIKYKNIRAFPIKKMSYILFFEIDGSTKTVNILSVFNTSQNPEKYP